MLPEEEKSKLDKFNAMPIAELEQGQAVGRWGSPNSVDCRDYNLAALVLARKKTERDEQKFRDTLQIAKDNAEATKRLVKANWALVLVTALLVLISGLSTCRQDKQKEKLKERNRSQSSP